ncbi:MAG: TlyA family RNA methyltransferase [Deltaproteobacteria bacterium]|nr:MAG: TlyA family RNA methyltransferase [Deltaproteobacteria bacterium]
MGKERLDQVLVERGLASSRARAKSLILLGAVLVDGEREDKAGTLVRSDAVIRITHNPQPYVSRGGLKLEKALEFFGINPQGKVAMDVGASTGGFTDCLLQKGARRVYAIDVGYGQLAWKLQQDPRVINLQRRNIRHLNREEVGEEVDLAVIDSSFISLTLVIPSTLTFLRKGGELVALLKPQFEVGRGEVGKGGVVRDPEKHRQSVEKVLRFGEDIGLTLRGVMESPLRGPKGNREFFLYFESPHGENRGS